MDRRVIGTFFLLNYCAFLQCYSWQNVMVVLPKSTDSLTLSCGHIVRVMTNTSRAMIWCIENFWAQNTAIHIKGNKNFSASSVKFRSENKFYEAFFIKSFWNAHFYNIFGGNTNWRLRLITGQQSDNIFGRIYFRTHCYNTGSFVSLASSLDNFTPGREDIFDFRAPNITEENFCVSIRNTLMENWQLTSFHLLNKDTGSKYSFYHNEKMIWQNYHRYKGPNSYVWLVDVVTGSHASDVGVDIIFNGDKCRSRITMDNKMDNFMVNGTDRFVVKARNCGLLKSVQLTCQTKCDWIMKNFTVTSKINPNITYCFTHGEALVGMHTFSTSEIMGPIKWLVLICTKTSTDEEVTIRLFGSVRSTKWLRLSTPEDDFRSNQCSKFTLFLDDIGAPRKFRIKKPLSLDIDKLIIQNNETRYEFALHGSKQASLTLLISGIGTSTISNTESPVTQFSMKTVGTSASTKKITSTKGIQIPFTYRPFTYGPSTFGPITTRPVTTGPKTHGPVSQGPFTQGPLSKGTVSKGTVSKATVSNGPVSQGPVTQKPVSQGPSTQNAITPQSSITNPDVTYSTENNTNISDDEYLNGSVATTQELSHSTPHDEKICSCPCVKHEDLEVRLKKLVKELKVNRNETTSYLRSKTSAPDTRVSSQVIGSTAVIIMAVPFGLIILVDLIPLLSFIYKKASSYF